MNGTGSDRIGRWGRVLLGVSVGVFLGAGLPIFEFASQDGGFGTPMARAQEELVVVEVVAVLVVLALRPLVARVPRARLPYGSLPVLALAFALVCAAVEWHEFGFADASALDALLGVSDRAKEMLPGLLAGWWLLRESRRGDRGASVLATVPAQTAPAPTIPAQRDEPVVELTLEPFEVLTERG
ncbi:hypothetical protein [Streptacidiphilus fuscans]|uniref:Uncharacterized protein n=1 Tax=Streptacidiphilus fuscans TaxID=2789292 RepID=A0A931B1B0_9ACTN|nr:hypothetical protein [Streptacidiphilus fuscans]MBF9068574.1 hypothetical protein [Streptacidiphilus fuscans]